MIKTTLFALMLGLGFASSAEAGCLAGAAAGGVVGHMAGHHGLAGAAVGCAIGHHEASKNKQMKQQTQTQGDQNTAH